MKHLKIKLNSIDKVKKFVNIVARYDGDFDIVSERYTIDAKSILGIFSLDLNKTLKLVIHSNIDTNQLLADLQEFIEEE